MKFEWDEEKNEVYQNRSFNVTAGFIIVFCERESRNIIRIISTRKATARERKQYEEGI